MKIVQEEDGRDFVIYSDSRSVVQSMEDRKTKHPLIRKLQHEIHEAKQNSKTVKICWVPGHAGIEGNETADREAKRASGAGNVIVAIPYTDMFAVIREKMEKRWEEQWHSKQQKMLEIKNDVKKWKGEQGYSRKEQVVLNRVRSGHTKLTHGYLMDRGIPDVPPVCSKCHNALMTVKHIFTQYEAIREERRRHFAWPDGQTTLKRVLGSKANLRQAINFLRDTGLYEVI